MKLKTKELTIASLMTALSIMIPLFMPRLEIPPFSATFASHVPIIITMFISPVAALFTAIGSCVGFTISLGNPFITARAFTHIVFAVFGAYLIKKRYNLVLILLLTMIVHSFFEAFVAVPIIRFVFPALPVKTTTNIVLYGTMIHHCIDFIIAIIILIPLSKAKFINYEFNKDSFSKLKG
jgi:niacin transporter